jgi:hypothetical protein
VEWIVGALVVLGFVAIAVRFVPREDAGRVRLPRIVDESVGMWALRRLTRRALWERPDEDAVDPDRPAGSGGPPSVAPNRFVASASRLEQLGVRSARHIGGRPSARAPHEVPRVSRSTTRLRQAQPPASLGLQRRLAAIAALLVVGAVVLGILLAPRGSSGDVLSATGRPGVNRGSDDPSSQVVPVSGADGSTAPSSSAATSTETIP